MRGMPMVTKAMKSTPTASQIMSVAGVVREGGADGDRRSNPRRQPVKDYVSRRRGPCSVVPMVTKEIKAAPTASQIMSVAGVVREGGADGDEGDEIHTDSVTDYVSRRRGP